MVKGTGVVAAALMIMLGGCATPAPHLPMQDYGKVAEATILLNGCIDSGAVSPEIGALGKQYISAQLNKHQYDYSMLDQAFKSKAQTGVEVTPSRCNQLATAVAAEKNRIQQHNTWAREQQQDMQHTIDTVNNTKPIYCNTVGGVVMCN